MARPFSRSKGSKSKPLQTTKPLIARLWTGNDKELCLCWAKAFLSTHTINIAYLR